MVLRQTRLDRATPWVVSGISSFYVMIRARRLSRAKPRRATLLRFLLDQADLVIVLGSSPLVWYISRHRGCNQDESYAALAIKTAELSFGLLHQLRQVFTGLLLGFPLLLRKAAADDLAGVKQIARRLYRVVHEGSEILGAFDELPLARVVVR